MKKVEIYMRESTTPYNIWKGFGYMPFEVHGQKFAVTMNRSTLEQSRTWRVTHIKTGAAVPGTEGATIAQAKANGMSILLSKGPEKLKEALEKVAEILKTTP